MEQMKYFEVNPGGNTTAIVRGIFSIEKRKIIALRIMSANKKIEQVGFWMPARSKNAVARLEMAGGEFCGNATRSLATILRRKHPFSLETSGLPKPVTVQASCRSASITIPMGKFILKDNICKLPGITHVLDSERISRSRAKKILGANKLLRKKAAGVIGYIKLNSRTCEIFPVVWVRDITTLIAETACASGTAALAYYYWKKGGTKTLRIKQPSGAIFSTRIEDNQLTLSGPIWDMHQETLGSS